MKVREKPNHLGEDGREREVIRERGRDNTNNRDQKNNAQHEREQIRGKVEGEERESRGSGRERGDRGERGERERGT